MWIIFPVIDLCRLNVNYYKIIIIKMFKISQFSKYLKHLKVKIHSHGEKITISMLLTSNITYPLCALKTLFCQKINKISYQKRVF